MATRKNTGAAEHRKVELLAAKRLLGPEHETQRAVWMLRLLLKASPGGQSGSNMDNIMEELSLVPKEVYELSPTQLRRRARVSLAAARTV